MIIYKATTRTHIVSIFLLICCIFLIYGVCSAAYAQTDGAAVVLDIKGAKHNALPKINDLYKNAAGIIKAYRAKGFYVDVDPSGQCLAVSKTQEIKDDSLSDDPISNNYILSRIIIEHITKAQLNAQKSNGYLNIDMLSKQQQKAVYQMAQRMGFINEQGQPFVSGARLKVIISPSWMLHLALHRQGQIISYKQTAWNNDPPTKIVVSKPPLHGSPLWYSWNYAESRWGNQKVNINAGTYALGDLLRIISKKGNCKVSAETAINNLHIAVAAKNISVKKLIWAIEVATGLQINKTMNSSQESILSSLQPTAEYNLLQPTKGIGYHRLPNSMETRSILKKLSVGISTPDDNSIIWRLSDLPLLYRNSIKENWPNSYMLCMGRGFDETNKSPSQNAPDIKPESTWVIWTRTIMVSIELEHPDGSGGGVETPLLAL